MLFLLSNVYEILFNQTISSKFESVWAIYFFGSLLVVVPMFLLAARGGRTLGRWASSMNLGVLLILAVTAATVLGTLVFQKRMPQEYVSAYGETLLNVFSVLHLVDVFHSVWFVNVLFVLIINILYCYISRREFTLRNLGGYVLHFGIVVSMIGAFIGFIYGVKGVIQLNEGDVVDAYVQREGQGPPRVSLGYEIVLDDFAIEWYEPKYLVNTFRVTPRGEN
jgi:cytochrome c biogenesis factor